MNNIIKVIIVILFLLTLSSLGLSFDENLGFSYDKELLIMGNNGETINKQIVIKNLDNLTKDINVVCSGSECQWLNYPESLFFNGLENKLINVTINIPPIAKESEYVSAIMFGNIQIKVIIIAYPSEYDKLITILNEERVFTSPSEEGKAITIHNYIFMLGLFLSFLALQSWIFFGVIGNRIKPYISGIIVIAGSIMIAFIITVIPYV